MTESKSKTVRRPEDRPGGRRLPYWVGYAVMTVLLLGVTVTLVAILPSRYALVADLREAGFSFPTSADAIGFPMPAREPLIEPAPPPVPPVAREPGPAEAMWADVDSLLAGRDYGAAVARMEAYLEEQPGDVAVQRERARTLAISGRTAAAREAFDALARRTGARSDRLALARLLRDAGEVDAAVSLYRDLLDAQPSDERLRHELAQLYLWADRHPEAITELERLVAAHPDSGAYRFDLARALYWNDRPGEARQVLAAMPEGALGAAGAADAAELAAELDRLLAPPPEPEPEPPTLVERARAAAGAEDFEVARRLYDEAASEAPGDSALARERADFLQYRVADLDAAIAALVAYDARFGLDADGRYRLAELYVWTGREADARRELVALVRDHPDRAEGWGLLGDVYRYADERGAARDAYERAQVLEPGEPHAAAGLPELDRLRRATVASHEPVGVGPSVSLFSDSDDFLRLDVGAGAGWAGEELAVDLTAGWRRLEGLDLGGLPVEDEGAFAALEAARWWSEASLRTGLRVGVDHLEAAGTEPVLGLSAARFWRSGGSVELQLEHGPAYPLTTTMESAAAEVVADRVQVAAYAPLSPELSLSIAAGVVRLSNAGPANTRLHGAATVARRLAPWLTADLGTRLVGFTDPAPVIGRRLYWDPQLFWSNTAGLTLGTPTREGLGYRLRLSAGAAWSDERDAAEAEWIPQFGAEAGLTWRSERTALDLGTFYRRSREDDYSSFGAELALRIRP